jgi:hypothetical protein
MDRLLAQMLKHLHESIDQLAEELERDRPELSNALKIQQASLPSPPSTVAPPSRNPRRGRARLPALLYGALDAGVVDARKFDRIMLLESRAARTLRARR